MPKAMLLLFTVVLMPTAHVLKPAEIMSAVQPALVIITQVCVNNSLPVMDSQPSAENDDSSISVILEGAVRLSSGIHCLLHSYKKVNTIAL